MPRQVRRAPARARVRIPALLATIVALVATTLALLPAPAQADPIVTGVTVTYSAWDDSVGTFKAFRETLDESPRQRLTATPTGVSERQPALSPDGTRVAVVLSWASPNAEVAVFDVGAATPVWSRSIPSLQAVAWSPDGSRLAMNTSTQVLTMPADGSADPVQMFRGENPGKPAWSPDSTRLAFADTSNGLLLVTVATKALSVLVENINGERVGTTPAWFPDGQSLLYVRIGAQWTARRVYLDGRPTESLPGVGVVEPANPVRDGWYAARLGGGENGLAFTNVETGETTNLSTHQASELTGWTGTPVPDPNHKPTLTAPTGDGVGHFFTDRTTPLKFTIGDLADTDGTASAVEVTWGDGPAETIPVPAYTGPSTTLEVSHTYSTAGDYPVGLVAVDNDGGRSEKHWLHAHVAALDAHVVRAAFGGESGDEVWLDVDMSGSQGLPAETLRYHVDTGAYQASDINPRLRVQAPAANGQVTVTVIGTHPATGDAVQLARRAFPFTFGTSDPPPPPTEQTGKIAAVGNSGDVVVYDDVTPGATPRVVFPDPTGRIANVSWDDTGERIVFRRMTGQKVTTPAGSTAVYEIWVVNADGTGAQRLVDRAAGAGNADLDGNRLIYDEYLPSSVSRAVRELNLSTGKTRTLYSGSPNTQNAQWSPDGARILAGTVALRADGTLLKDRFLGPEPEMLMVLGERWHPNGRTIIGTRANATPTRIYTASIDPAISDVEDITSAGRNLQSPAFGPGGNKYVAYGFAGPGTTDLWVVDATSGTAPFRLGTGFAPDWFTPPTPPNTGGPQITVTSTSDPAPGTDPDPGCHAAPGDCTLRDAITAVNNGTHTGTAIIDLPDDQGPIRITHPLPVITKPLILVGGGTPGGLLSDPGVDFGATGGAVGTGGADGCSGKPVFLNGQQAGPDSHGLVIRTGRGAARSTMLYRLAIDQFGGDGIHVVNSAHVRFGCSSSGYNGGAGMSVHDSVDVSAIGEIAFSGNRGDGLRVTGASRRVRFWAGGIEWNGGLAIDLGDDGVTDNDTGDGDTGPNGLVNQPTIVRVVDDPNQADSARLLAYVRVTHDVSKGPFRVDLYRGIGCDPSGHGELFHWLAGAQADLRSTNARLLRIPVLDGGYGPLSATVSTGAGTSEASRCATSRGPSADAPVTEPVVDPTRVTWTNPGAPAPAGSVGGGGQAGDPATGAGGAGTWGGDIVDDGATGVTGAPTGDDPAGGPDGTPPTDGRMFDVDAHLVIATSGTVHVDPAPGPLMGVSGGTAPYRVVKETGGTMPADAWSVNPGTGQITVAARTLAPGKYFGQFRVADAAGETTMSRPVIFLIQPATATPDPPEKLVARPDRVVIEPGDTVTFTGGENVLANDTFTAPLTAGSLAGSTLPAGRVTLNANGNFTVNATGMKEGTYRFTYRARATATTQSAPTTVTVVVDNFNRCATAVNDTWQVVSGQLYDIPAADGVLANDTDPEDQQLRARVVGTFNQPKILDMKTDGAVHLDARNFAPGTFRQFEYHAVDPYGEVCPAATVRLNVAENDPPTAGDNGFTVQKGTTFTLPDRGVLGDDLDPDGPELGLTAAVVATTKGLTLNGDGGLTYSVPDAVGTYTATYRAVDRWGARSAPATIVFHVVAEAQPVNHAPAALNGTFAGVVEATGLGSAPVDGLHGVAGQRPEAHA